jgi:hypothetical protein
VHLEETTLYKPHNPDRDVILLTVDEIYGTSSTHNPHSLEETTLYKPHNPDRDAILLTVDEIYGTSSTRNLNPAGVTLAVIRHVGDGVVC